MIHTLKIWPEFFQAIVDDLKLFEIRKNDRDYKVGDVLILTEYEPKQQKYTGRGLSVDVIYLTHFSVGLGADFVFMSIQKPRINTHDINIRNILI